MNLHSPPPDVRPEAAGATSGKYQVPLLPLQVLLVLSVLVLSVRRWSTRPDSFSHRLTGDGVAGDHPKAGRLQDVADRSSERRPSAVPRGR
ncbi:hypothetical protein [Kribbella ginsengisoli]|uniref:Uncharacterized protein n=1 Tax=Kribbella ginsengisoli TaxID=363865 RepID=A0ABP6WUR1_9ACTN